MDFKVLIGRKVVNKVLGAGVILGIDNANVAVDFNGTIKKFQLETLDKFFSFEDKGTRELIQGVISEIKAAKAAAEEAKKAAKEAAEKARQEEAERLAREEAERLEREKRDKKKTRNLPRNDVLITQKGEEVFMQISEK